MTDQNDVFADLLNNPEKLADMSIADIEASLAAKPAAVEDKPKDGETVESPATAAEVKTDANVKEEGQPQGIKDKTGENIIPYEVLSSERLKSKQLAEGKQQAEARAAELEKQLQGLSVANVEIDESSFLSDEEIEALAEEMPSEAERITKFQNLIRSQAALLQQKENEKSDLNDQLLKDSIQQSIDSVPKLAYIQATKPTLFKLAVEMDVQLREEAQTNTVIANMTLKERFELAVTRLEEELGFEIDVKKSSTPSSEQLKQAALQAKTAADSKAVATPLSMADIPGGTIPPVDDLSEFFNKSPAEMEVAMSKMSASQKQKLYDRIT